MVTTWKPTHKKHFFQRKKKKKKKKLKIKHSRYKTKLKIKHSRNETTLKQLTFKWGNPLQNLNEQSGIHWLHQIPFLSVSSICCFLMLIEETERKGVRCSQWIADYPFKYWSVFAHLNVSFFSMVSFLECFIFNFVLYLE